MMKTLKLNNQIYDLDAIKSAILAYRQLCKVEVILDAQYYTLMLADCVYDEGLTAKELCNAVLIETIRRKGSLYD